MGFYLAYRVILCVSSFRVSLVSEDRFKKSVDLYLDESIVASYEFEILTI